MQQHDNRRAGGAGLPVKNVHAFCLMPFVGLAGSGGRQHVCGLHDSPRSGTCSEYGTDGSENVPDVQCPLVAFS